MWHPNRSQWLIIWVFALFGLGVWVQQKHFVLVRPVYEYTGETNSLGIPQRRVVGRTIKLEWLRAASRLAVSSLVLGALIVWQLSGRQRKETQPQSPTASPRIWYVAKNGKTEGSISREEFAKGKQSGKYSDETLVFTKGMSEWTRAGHVAELGGEPPPALPPVPES